MTESEETKQGGGWLGKEFLDEFMQGEKLEDVQISEDKHYLWEAIVIAEDGTVHVSFTDHRLNADMSGRYRVKPGEPRYEEIMARHPGAKPGELHAAVLPNDEPGA
jgi:hypothetical protein